MRRIRPHWLTADLEVFLNGKISEDPAFFRHITKPAPHDRVGRLVGYIPSLERNTAGALRDETNDGAKGRGFSGAVTAEQRDHLAVAHFQRNVEQDMRRAVMAVEILHAELHADVPSRWRTSYTSPSPR